jgi:hypothetical protein
VKNLKSQRIENGIKNLRKKENLLGEPQDVMNFSSPKSEILTISSSSLPAKSKFSGASSQQRSMGSPLQTS